MSPKRTDEHASIQAGLRGLHQLLGHRTRLGICVLLARHDRVAFSRLKALLEETDGSLGAQLRKLEEEGLVSVHKEFLNRKPVSWYALTRTGRSALSTHLEALARLMET